jgi:biopolymer transport protein ExbB
MQNVIQFIRAGGFVMYPLMLLSLVAVVVVVERLLAYRQLAHLSPGLLPEVIRLARAGQYEQALKACEGRQGPVAACLAVILRHRNHPVREVERQVEETGQEYFIRLERFLPVLDTTTTISPLLGLLGTIAGMIGTFHAIAAQQNRGNSDAVLAGVGEALYATATGILIAVICFVAYNYFAARLRTVTSETEQAATKLINVLTELHHRERRHEEPAASTNHLPEVSQSSAGEQQGRGIQAKARA